MRTRGDNYGVRLPAIDDIVESALDAILKHYVFPETAAALDGQIRAHLDRGRYHQVSVEELADLLTADIQSVSHDQHLYVRTKADHDRLLNSLQARVPPSSTSAVRSELLIGNVGYVEFCLFRDREFGSSEVANAMSCIEAAKALIVDLRRCVGGDPNTVALAATYFFGQVPLHLNTIYWRSGNRYEEFWTIPVAVQRRFEDQRVFVLTSTETASGGEEFAYDLQAQGRALIIGERSRGAAHPGDYHPISDDLVLFVPDGRPINPITRTNWQGVGVIPDIETTAAEAIDVALLRALVDG